MITKSVKQARDMDIPENWIHSPGIFPYPGNGDNIFFLDSSFGLSVDGVFGILSKRDKFGADYFFRDTKIKI